MSLLLRAAGMLVPAALGACTMEERHPVDRQLSGLRPATVTPLAAGADWPAGTLLCPMTPYQDSLPASAPEAERVNAYLKRKQFQGDEGHWSLVVIKPGAAGDQNIGQLVFKRGNYDVVTGEQRLGDASAAVPASFRLQACVPVEYARVLAVRPHPSARPLVVFGTEIGK